MKKIKCILCVLLAVLLLPSCAALPTVGTRSTATVSDEQSDTDKASEQISEEAMNGEDEMQTIMKIGDMTFTVQLEDNETAAAFTELLPNAVHTDLYDRKDVIPFDRIEAFLREYLK